MNLETAIAAMVGAVLSFAVSMLLASIRRGQETRDLASELRASVAALDATLKAMSNHIARLDREFSKLPCRECEPPGRRQIA